MKKLLTAGLVLLTVATATSSFAQRPKGDRDRDGIPNRADRRDGPAPKGDRDHDGVPNAVDKWDPKWGPAVPPPGHWGNRPGWNQHVRLCLAAYPSYVPRTDTYQVRPGVRARCTL